MQATSLNDGAASAIDRPKNLNPSGGRRQLTYFSDRRSEARLGAHIAKVWKVGTHSVSVSGIDIHSKNYTMSLFRRFILSGVGAALLFASGLLVITATPAAVPINSFYGAWSSQVTYPKGSVVTSGGSSYISLLGSATNPNLNHSP